MAKLTINPAIAHGLNHEIGSLDVGKLADIVLWRPDHFGAKPQLVLKSGLPGVRRHRRSERGDRFERTAWCSARSSVRTARPPPTCRWRSSAKPRSTPATITWPPAADALRCKGTRNIGPADLVHNNRLGHVDVDPKTGMVSLDGDTVYSDPADSVSLSRLYFL